MTVDDDTLANTETQRQCANSLKLNYSANNYDLALTVSRLCQGTQGTGPNADKDDRFSSVMFITYRAEGLRDEETGERQNQEPAKIGKQV